VLHRLRFRNVLQRLRAKHHSQLAFVVHFPFDLGVWTFIRAVVLPTQDRDSVNINTRENGEFYYCQTTKTAQIVC
jgi:hypothetical protein